MSEDIDEEIEDIVLQVLEERELLDRGAIKA